MVSKWAALSQQCQALKKRKAGSVRYTRYTNLGKSEHKENRFFPLPYGLRNVVVGPWKFKQKPSGLVVVENLLKPIRFMALMALRNAPPPPDPQYRFMVGHGSHLGMDEDGILHLIVSMFGLFLCKFHLNCECVVYYLYNQQLRYKLKVRSAIPYSLYKDRQWLRKSWGYDLIYRDPRLWQWTLAQRRPSAIKAWTRTV